VERTLSYNVAPDGQYLFLTLFRLDRAQETEVARAREAMTKAAAAGHFGGHALRSGGWSG